MDKEQIVKSIKESLYKHYHITSDGDCGTYINGKWLSVDNVIRIIEENL